MVRRLTKQWIAAVRRPRFTFARKGLFHLPAI
jgi:hypothetical protein